VYDSEKLSERIAKLAGGVAVIKVRFPGLKEVSFTWRAYLARAGTRPATGCAATILWRKGQHAAMGPSVCLAAGSSLENVLRAVLPSPHPLKVGLGTEAAAGGRICCISMQRFADALST